MTTKTCFRCGKEKPLSEFYKHPEMTDRHLGKCKECTKKDVRENRAARKEQYSEYEKVRRQRPERKAYQTEQTRQYRLKYPERARAHSIVNYHIRVGNLVPKPCEVCGELEVQAHHDNYSEPLNVRWLCFGHHRALHRQSVHKHDRAPTVTAKGED